MSKGILIAAAGTVVLGISLVVFPQTRAPDLEVNALSPREDTLREPIVLQVKVEPWAAADEEIRLVCRKRNYRGEYSGTRGEGTLRMAISGAIERTSAGTFLTSYELEVRFVTRSGMWRLAASGSAVLSEGKPAKVVTGARTSVVITVGSVSEGHDSATETGQ